MTARNMPSFFWPAYDRKTVNTVQILRPPEDFDFCKPELWPLWKKRFQRYIRVAKICCDSEAEKIDILCYTMGEQVEAILAETIPNTGIKNLENVLQSFTDYFSSMESLTSKVYRFNSRTQESNETVEQFITSLHNLAESCEYGIITNDLITDRIVAGLRDSRIRKKLELETNLTLENAITIALQAETQRGEKPWSLIPSDFFSQPHGIEEIPSYDSSKARNFTEVRSPDVVSAADVKHQECESETVSCTESKVDQNSAGEQNKDRLYHEGDDQEKHDLPQDPNTSEENFGQSPVSANRNNQSGIRSDNVQRLDQLELDDRDEEDPETKDFERVRERVRDLIKNLKVENYDTTHAQLMNLEIDSQEKLQSVVSLIFKAAVDNPSFSEWYARMCNELATMQVNSPESEGKENKSNMNLKKLINTHCHLELEINTMSNYMKAIRIKEIQACADPDKKVELQLALTEEEEKIAIKSSNIITFIGELFKQEVLTNNIMHKCIQHLLPHVYERNLECLCKLFNSFGKDLESRNQKLDKYFAQLGDIVDRKVPGALSSRVRSMLQDLIELQMNQWVPGAGNSNPKVLNKVQKAGTRRPNTHTNITPKNSSSKNHQNSAGKKHGDAEGTKKKRRYFFRPPRMSVPQIGIEKESKKSEKVSSCSTSETGATSNKAAMLENISSDQDKLAALPPIFGSKSSNLEDNDNPDRATSCTLASTSTKSVPIMSEEQLAKKAADILEEYLLDSHIGYATLQVLTTFDNSTLAGFVREALNGVVEKSANAKKQVGQLMTYLISENILPLSLYLAGLAEVLDMAVDRVIDIPGTWVYLAELIWYPLAEGVHPFSELKTMIAPLKMKGLAEKLMGELMIVLLREQGEEWVKENWDRSGLERNDFLQENESLNDFFWKYKLDFNFEDSDSDLSDSSEKLSMEQIHERLRSLMSNEKESSFGNICNWISENVGERASEPQFIKVLMTAILEVSIEPYDNTWVLKSNKFEHLRPLISWHTDVLDISSLQLQCLIVIQEYIHKLEHPKGLLLEIIQRLWNTIISTDALLAWRTNKDPTALTGRSEAMMVLTHFFATICDTDDEFSSDEQQYEA